METKNVRNQHLSHADAVRNGNSLNSVEAALCSRMPYQPASVTVIEMRVEEGIAQSGPNFGDGGRY